MAGLSFSESVKMNLTLIQIRFVGVDFGSIRRQRKIKEVVDGLDGAHLMRVGPRETDHVVIHCHGGGFVGPLSDFQVEFWYRVQQALLKTKHFMTMGVPASKICLAGDCGCKYPRAASRTYPPRFFFGYPRLNHTMYTCSQKLHQKGGLPVWTSIVRFSQAMQQVHTDVQLDVQDGGVHCDIAAKSKTPHPVERRVTE
ncbi:hypothetical protein C8R44DRAFT_750147 [Mycena epipterygia]|nr:hypothetical protein C8R44DRAFT_750147 [Mycena epipterygia]